MNEQHVNHVVHGGDHDCNGHWESDRNENIMLFSVLVEGGRVHYLTDLASEHKKMLLQCPVAMEKDGLAWTHMVQANVKVSVFLL